MIPMVITVKNLNKLLFYFPPALLRWHVMHYFVGGEALSRAEPPAGPPKFDLLVADATFPEISVIFGIMPEPILTYSFF